MTPVTMELDIDDSKLERKDRRGYGKQWNLCRGEGIATLHNRLRAQSSVNENAGASPMNGEMDE
jgi:hypothetical protein